MTEKMIRRALGQIPYPGFSRDIVSAGVIRSLQITGERVAIELALEHADRETREAIRSAIRAAISQIPNVSNVELTPPEESPRSMKPLPSAGKSPAPQPARQTAIEAKQIFGVASGKGGVGKSTVAVNLAVSLAREGLSVGFLDADVHGPSAPLMFGLTGRKPELSARGGKPLPIEAFGVRVMSIGFFVDRGSAVIWRGPIVGNFIRQLLSDVEWGELDVLVIDFPPGTGDAQLTISQTLSLSGSVIVSTSNELAMADAYKAVAMFRKVGVPILGLVENMAYFTCEKCGERTEIFGESRVQRAADQEKVPFLGQIPIDPLVVAESDRGEPVVISRPDSAIAERYRSIALAARDSLSGEAGEEKSRLGAFLERFGGR